MGFTNLVNLIPMLRVLASGYSRLLAIFLCISLQIFLKKKGDVMSILRRPQRNLVDDQFQFITSGNVQMPGLLQPSAVYLPSS